MRVTYDADADAAYLYILEDGDSPVATTVCGEEAAEGINLDFDAEGRLLGIEILDAEARLPANLLQRD